MFVSCSAYCCCHLQCSLSNCPTTSFPIEAELCKDKQSACKSLGFLKHLPVQVWPWEDSSLSELEMAFRRMRAMFEFLEKLGADFWAFHDRRAPACPYFEHCCVLALLAC